MLRLPSLLHRRDWQEPQDKTGSRLTEHKRATRNGDVNNHIAEHRRHTNHTIDWDSAQCVTYSTNYFQRLTLESLEQTPQGHPTTVFSQML